ncbi:sigma 54-interacting transcriptional regulator [Verrucomicrobiaceae bacterium R5-34]|nr:sigma 54-interacting transcriptional regulator [Verrucomicrobiaceae bacterium R5-34]
MQILLTFTGFHDPFNPAQADGRITAGPVLTVLAHRKFDKVCLLSTQKTAERSAATATSIKERHPELAVDEVELMLKDPTNHLGILRQLRQVFSKIQAAHSDGQYTISLSSGTPHMHACWLLLTASGEIPATLLQPQRPEHTPEGRSPIRDVDLTQADFPQVTRPLRSDIEESDEVDLLQACDYLNIVGNAPSFQQALQRASVLAQYSDHILLLGETGTGKEYFANLIHYLAPHTQKEIVVVNCGSIPENLVESVLFGHTKGAFTGATTAKLGKFQSADGGILFLDELGELPLAAQAKLLRALDQGEVEPVGAAKPTKVNVQVIAATNKDILTMVHESEFREDLYQRFSATVRIPSLRQRKSDIPALAIHLLNLWNSQNKKQLRITPDAIHELTKHPWPGNVRELASTIKNSAKFTTGNTICTEQLCFSDSLHKDHTYIPEPEQGFNITDFLDNAKEQLITRAIEKTKTQAEAAKLLGWTPAALSNYFARKKTPS